MRKSNNWMQKFSNVQVYSLPWTSLSSMLFLFVQVIERMKSDKSQDLKTIINW